MSTFDIDEFLVVFPQLPQNPPFAGTGKPFMLHMLLNRWEGWRTGGIIVDRLTFGCGGHDNPPDDLVTAAYTTRILGMYVGQVVGKFFSLTPALEQTVSAHDLKVKDGFKKVTADNEVLNDTHTPVRYHRYEPVRFNQYSTRSYSECVAKINLSRWSEKTDWRKKIGTALCDRNFFLAKASTRSTKMRRITRCRHRSSLQSYEKSRRS